MKERWREIERAGREGARKRKTDREIWIEKEIERDREWGREIERDVQSEEKER